MLRNWAPAGSGAVFTIGYLQDGWFFIPLFDFSEELLGDVPRGCISGQIDGLAVAILGAQQIHHLDHLLGIFLRRIEVGHLVPRQFQSCGNQGRLTRMEVA